MTKSKKGAAQTGRRERRKFTDEYKREAVRLMYERRSAGVTLGQVSRDLDIGVGQLRRWATQLRVKQGGGLGAGQGGNQGDSGPDVVESPEQELRRLRRENLQLKQEREFAKKVAVYFAKESH